MKELEPKELIYGEVAYKGYQRIIDLVKASQAKTFVDVGSGYGKICTAVNQQLDIDCIGIEINKEMVDISRKISYTPHREKLKYYCKDFREPEMLKIINEADFVFANVLMFTEENINILFDNCSSIVFHNHHLLPKRANVEMPVTWLAGERTMSYYFIDKRVPV